MKRGLIGIVMALVFVSMRSEELAGDIYEPDNSGRIYYEKSDLPGYKTKMVVEPYLK